MSIKYEGTAKLLSAESNAYDFADAKGERVQGTSHQVRVSVDGEIYAFRTTEANIKKLQDSIGSDVDVVIEITSRKERLGSKLVSVDGKDL